MCEISSRPIDIHILILSMLIRIARLHLGFVHCRAVRSAGSANVPESLYPKDWVIRRKTKFSAALDLARVTCRGGKTGRGVKSQILKSSDISTRLSDLCWILGEVCERGKTAQKLIIPVALSCVYSIFPVRSPFSRGNFLYGKHMN